jgi:hypothetical protein
MLCVSCGQKGSLQRIFIKKCFLFSVGSVCLVKRFTSGSRNYLKVIQFRHNATIYYYSLVAL